jgi:dolichol-phosphate mannosyltransferase
VNARVLAIIPTYEEAENIGEVLQRVRGALPDADILVIDDGSPDGTADVVRVGARELQNIVLLERGEKRGLGSAYRDGFAYGLERGYDVLVEMDADLSHDPSVIPRLVAPIEGGADLTIGSRYVTGGATPGWKRSRRVLSRAGNRYAQLALGMHASDATSGFRAYRAAALQEIDFASTRATGYGFQIELTHRINWAGGRIAEVPIVFADRRRGQSKMSLRIAAEAFVLVTLCALRDRVSGSDRRGRAEPEPDVRAAA